MKIRISKSYGEKEVLKKLRLEVADGEIVALLGGSGAGKTTLLNILAGLTDYVGEIENMPQSVGYIFQEPRLLPNLTVRENLAYAGGRYENIDEILQKIGLFEHRDKRPLSLSGGEKQRVAIARAFLSDAPLILLDEPFSSLDAAWKLRLAETFATLWRERKKTAILVTHDVEEVWLLAHRAVILKEGAIASEIPLEKSWLPRAYGDGGQVKKEIVNALLGR